MRSWKNPVATALAVLAASTAVAEGPGSPVVSGAGARRGVDVTVYNRDLALVRETRSIDLPAGEVRLEFRDVPARIDPVTLLVAAGEPGRFEILEQNYEFDLLSYQRILEKYVGRDVAWIQEDGSRVQGTLLGMSGGPVFRVGEEIVFEVPGRLALPDLPANLRDRPTLAWLASSSKRGALDVEASYLTRGLSWQADYVLQLDEAGRRADLQAWVSVDNRSGGSFEGARLLLVAGDINQVAPAPEMLMAMDTVMKAAPPRGFVEEALYDYHLYTLQQPTTLLDNQIKQIALFEASGLGVKKHYRLQGRTHFFRGVGRLDDRPSVDVSYSWENTQANGLGKPLPAGVVRVYGRSSGGGRQLLGEDRIGHTPVDEKVELRVGSAFDLVAERVRTDSRKLAEDLTRHSFAITLRNHRSESVVVEVIEPVGGFWEVQQSSVKARKVDASTLAFDVTVPAGGETVLTYSVDVRY
ncbi:MAG: DUF4139 domain-containing protein [bacterium]|nr:DUF4139 domain-containing protein [bacterium]